MAAVYEQDRALYGELIVLLQDLERGPRLQDTFVKKLSTGKHDGDLFYGVDETNSGPWQLSYLRLSAKREIIVALLKPVIRE